LRISQGSVVTVEDEVGKITNISSTFPQEHVHRITTARKKDTDIYTRMQH